MESDFYSSSILALHEHYTDDSKTKLILCAGHCNRAQQTHLKSFAKSKKCTKNVVLDHQKEYPYVKKCKMPLSVTIQSVLERFFAPGKT